MRAEALASQTADARFYALESVSGASVSLDTQVGHLRDLTFIDGGRQLVPLHRPHWVCGDGMSDAPAASPEVERHLSGDFLCMPFGPSDDPARPPHGWSANSAWRITAAGSSALVATLARDVFSATVTKRLRLSADSPLLYQTHIVDSGADTATLAHHAMVRLQGQGRLSMSPKRAFVTPDQPLDAGRNRLACPALSDAAERITSIDGGTADITRLPFGERHEDFITAVEAKPAGLGWTALVREAEDDIVFFLKDAAVLPVTMFWFSNGGRDYAPWNGVHTGVIGIEDGRTAGALPNLAAADPDNAIAQQGVPTVFELGEGRQHGVRQVIGAVARDGATCVENISVDGGSLVLTFDNGRSRELAFDAHFFNDGDD